MFRTAQREQAPLPHRTNPFYPISTQPRTMDAFVIAYLPLFPGNPPTIVGAFILDPELGVPIHGGRRYDLTNPADLVDFDAAQGAVFKATLYKHRRVRILPVSYFERAAADRVEAQVELARVTEADRNEGERLRLLAEAAEPVVVPVRAAPPGFEGAEEVADETEEPFEVADEIPPYEEWPLAELVAELKQRKLKLPKGSDKTDPAAYIAVLDEDDAQDPEA
jgi:hypothetical protein